MVRLIQVVLCFLFLFPQMSLGAGLGVSLETMLQQHPSLVAAQESLQSSQQRKNAKFRDRWTPELNVSYKYGGQHYQLAGSQRYDEDVHEFTVRLEQRLTDFGESRAEVAADAYSVLQKESTVSVVRQKLIMEAIDAYLQVQKAQQVKEYAQQSRDNIQQQTNLESMMVEKGKGYSSNVLQAKTQLAGAKARLNRAEADLDVSMAKAEELFEDSLATLDFNQQFDLNSIPLPASLPETIALAVKNNPRIEVGAYRSKTLEEKISYESRKNFYPDLALVGELERNRDLDGHDGTDRDDKILIEFSYPINLGLSGVHHTKAARHEMNSSKEQEQVTIRELEKSAKIAWRNFQTSSDNKVLLDNKVNIAAEFLRLAQEERKAGRRSLLEVLSAETTLINSQGELAAARADQLRSAFSLLYVTGALNVASVEHAIRN